MENRDRILTPVLQNPILTLKRSDGTLQPFIEKWKTSVVYPKLSATALEDLFNPGSRDKFAADFGERNYLIQGLANLGISRKEFEKLPKSAQQELVKTVIRREFNLEENDPQIQIISEGHSQLPSYFIAKYLFEEALYTQALAEEQITAEPGTDEYAEKGAALLDLKSTTYQLKQPANPIQNLVKREDGYFLELYMEDFSIDEINGNGDSVGLFHAPVKMIFQLVRQENGTEDENEWGYKLIELQTSSADLVKMLNGQGLTEAELNEKYCQPEQAFQATIYALESSFATKLKNLTSDDLDSGLIEHSPHYNLIDQNLRGLIELIKQVQHPNHVELTNLMRILKTVSNHPNSHKEIEKLENLQNNFSPEINTAIQDFLKQLEKIAKLKLSQEVFKNRNFKDLNTHARTMLDEDDFKAELARVSVADRVNLLSLVSKFLANPLDSMLIRDLSKAAIQVQQQHNDTQLSQELQRIMQSVFSTARMTLGGETYTYSVKGAAQNTLPAVKKEVVELITKARNIVENSTNPDLIAKISLALNAASNLLTPRNQANHVNELNNIIVELNTDHGDAVASIMPHLEAIRAQAPAIQAANATTSILTESMSTVNLKLTNWVKFVDNEVESIMTSSDENPVKKEKKALSNEAERQSEINEQIKKLTTDLQKQIQKAVLDPKNELTLDDLKALKSFMLSVENYLREPKDLANSIADGFDRYIANRNLPPKLKRVAQHLGELSQFAEARKHLIATINQPGYKDSSIATASRELLTDIDIRSSNISKPNDRMRLMSDALNETAEIVKNNNRDLTKYRQVANEISNIPGWKKALGIIVGITGLALIGASVVVACASMGVFSLPSVGGIAVGVSMITFGASVGFGAAVAGGSVFSLWRILRKPVKGDMEEVMKQVPPRNAV